MQNKLSYILKELRIKYKMNQTEIAKQINVSQRAYSFYETGEREPKIDTLIKLSNIYGIPIDVLVGKYELPQREAHHE
jgi:transcriptional regulator with XRE-family HTH domain